ncbi:MAG TPA: hypothetical protein VKZ58_03090 [Longimicrobiales bacterium]|nr:hypothetical protein [Longimicrobiales bacterium]
MGGLNFERAANLFLGTERELAMALGLELGDFRMYRQSPERAPREVLERLGKVLIERGRGMVRVGEMLQEMATER